MDNNIFDKIYDRVPPFNPLICDGYAVTEMRSVDEYVDHIWRCAQESFPPRLTYDGYRRTSPRVEYATITKKRNNVQAYELATSYVYMNDYRLLLDGKPLLPQRFYLPYVKDGGEILMRGSSFFIKAVLADKSISDDVNKLFIPLNRDKLTFERLSYSYLVGDKTETEYVYWSAIHHALNNTKGTDPSIPSNIKTPLFLYMFCKYGVTATFRMLMKDGELVFGNGADQMAEELPGYTICQSTGFKPVNLKQNYYAPSSLSVAIKTSEFTASLSSLVATLFYIVDLFPTRIRVEDLDNTRLWKILLGEIIFKNKNNVGKLVDGVDNHLLSLDGYMDAMVREKLASDDIHVTTIYDFFLYVVDNFTKRIVNSDPASIYNKCFTVLRYALFDINKAISNLVFKLQSLPENFTEKEVNNILTRSLKPDIIFDLIKGGHGEVSNVSYSGDNKLYKITSDIVLQSDATPGAGGGLKTSNLRDPAKFLHSSVIEVGSVTNQPKSEPTGKTRANPRVRIRKDGSIERDPARMEFLDNEVQPTIARK